MPATAPSLLWLRSDLRLSDNPALQAAVEHGGPVIPIFIHDPEAEGKWAPGGASNWWLHHALQDLATQFSKAGSPLIIRKGPAERELLKLVKETGATAVFWNRRYEPLIQARDTTIKTALREAGLRADSFNGGLLHDPVVVRNLSGKPFQVFTPFWKHCLAHIKFGRPLAAPRSLKAPTQTLRSVTVESLNLLPKIKWDGAFLKVWNPTRKGAETRLAGFIAQAVHDYSDGRDIPETDGTSRLSPYLHFGQLSPREIVAAVEDAGIAKRLGPLKFVAEVGWREFGHHLLHHFPGTTDQPLRPEYRAFPWSKDPALVKAWQKGSTGYPIVDAGLRQLWETGWMHNRVRMIVASVLVKHFLQPWQVGAAWFYDTLVDADLASNTMGWQWAAGCGADAAPYFRVFNPVLQGEKFDPEGAYVRRYVPELAKLPAAWIHKPWDAPPAVLSAAGVILDRTYPKPRVGLTEGRNRALAAFERLKAGM